MTLPNLRDEALQPALEAHLNPTEEIGPVLQHPLVYGIPYLPALNSMYNDQLKRKTRDAAIAHAAQDWHTYVFLHERAFRIPALDELFCEIPDEKFWPLVGEVYIDSENIHQYHDIVHSWLDVPIKTISPSIMDEDEQALLRNLPDTVTVYRGYTEDEDMDASDIDWSWTLEWEVAKWFAVRFDRKGFVVKGSIRKQDIMAVLTRRNEKEVLAWADNVQNKERLDA